VHRLRSPNCDGCDVEEAASRIEQLEAALDDVATHLPRAEWHYLKDETLITIGEKKDD